MNTPDTEFDSDKEVVGSDCLCVLGSKKHNPECEYATPDTEWDKITFENEFAGWWDNKTALTERIEDHITSLLSSRDTYWKERVRKEVEGMKRKITFNGSDESGFIQYGKVIDSDCEYNQALDTVIEKIKNK